MRADHDVLQRRHARKHARGLECPDDPARRDPLRRLPGGIFAEEVNFTCSGRKQFGRNVEQRGLAGAIRSDQGAEAAARHRQGHIVNGVQAAEYFRHCTAGQRGGGHRSAFERASLERCSGRRWGLARPVAPLWSCQIGLTMSATSDRFQ